MSTGMRVSKEVMDKVADYLKAATLDTGSVSRSVYNIAKDLGMASATVDRAIRALKEVGVITLSTHGFGVLHRPYSSRANHLTARSASFGYILTESR